MFRKSLGLAGIDPIDVIENNMVPMPFVGSFKRCSAPGPRAMRFSYEKWMRHGTINKDLDHRYILMNNEGVDGCGFVNVAKWLLVKQVTWQIVGFSTTSMRSVVTENFDKFDLVWLVTSSITHLGMSLRTGMLSWLRGGCFTAITRTKKLSLVQFFFTPWIQILRLLHPIMPFVTEEIYGQISEGTIVTAGTQWFVRIWKRRSSSRRWS